MNPSTAEAVLAICTGFTVAGAADVAAEEMSCNMDAASADGCCGAAVLPLPLLNLDWPNIPSIIGRIDCPKGLRMVSGQCTSCIQCVSAAATAAALTC